MPTRPRRLLLLAVVAVAMTLAGGVWLLWPRSAITWENYERIHNGMTRGEVETILGWPAHDESNGRIGTGPLPGAVVWVGADCTSYCLFSVDGRVERKAFERNFR